MFTTVCDAVSTNRWLRSAAASMCWLESNASQVNRPVTAAATNTVASETQSTSARFGCRRGGGPGLLSRTLTGLGASRLTPAADDAVPRAGPAARDARRRTGFDTETVSSVITPALEPTSDQPNSPRAPVCQHRVRRRQFPRQGRRTYRSGRMSRSPAPRWPGGTTRPEGRGTAPPREEAVRHLRVAAGPAGPVVV